MPMQLKKSELVQARLSYEDHIEWKDMCEAHEESSSEALRNAMSDYIAKRKQETEPS